MLVVARFTWFFPLLAIVSCSHPTTGACGQDAISTQSFLASGSCAVAVQNWPDEGHDHLLAGSTVHYCTEPPSSGNHYPYWAVYKTYTQPVLTGYLVHDLEHGAVVVTYRCDDADCTDTVSALQAVIDARPDDPLCDGTGARARLVLAPDPSLDVPVAAAAWTWTYRATCVDPPSLNAFMDAHYGQGREPTCAPGAYDSP